MAAVALLASRGALATTGELACANTLAASTRVTFFCEADGTVAVGANWTYTVAVEESAAENQLYDLNVTLKSVTGDADLYALPLASFFTA